jgi:cytochrome c553
MMYLSSFLSQTGQKGFAQVGRLAAWRVLVLVMAVGHIEPAGAGGSVVTPDVTALGRHLARECVGCHSVSGVNGASPHAIPILVGRPVDDLIALLNTYATGQRVAGRPVNAAMVSVAQSLTESERAAVAQYLASQPALR